MCCPLVFEFSVGIGGFVIGLGQIVFFFSLYVKRGFADSLCYLLTVCFAGDLFDVKEFHHQILKVGPVSLSILEEIINNWISSYHMIPTDTTQSTTVQSTLLTKTFTPLNETEGVVINEEVKPVQGELRSGSDKFALGFQILILCVMLCLWK